MSERMNYAEVAPRGVKALGGVHAYIAQSGLPPVLVTLVYLRVSLINGCAYCIDMHSQVSEHFDDKELADLTIAIGLMNAYNRLAISFRTPPAALGPKTG